MHNNENHSFDQGYQYKYNGKELQETGMYDYGARFYMPDLGRWSVMDKLSESYNSTSPYAYVLNNPISFIDPDGRLTQAFISAIWNSSGSGITNWYNTGDGFQSDGGVKIGYAGNYISLSMAFSEGGIGAAI